MRSCPTAAGDIPLARLTVVAILVVLPGKAGVTVRLIDQHQDATVERNHLLLDSFMPVTSGLLLVDFGHHQTQDNIADVKTESMICTYTKF